MEIVNGVLISVNETDLIDGVFYNETITEVGDNCFQNMETLKEVNLPNCKICGNLCFNENQVLTTISLPNCKICRNWCFRDNDLLSTITLPNCKICGNWCFRGNQALTTISLPNLTTCGDLCFKENQALTTISLPNLTTCRNWCFIDNKNLNPIKLNKHNLSVKSIDGLLFVIESQKTLKELKIYSGYIFNSMTDAIIDKNICYVGEKDNFFAHGETVKKSIQDLQFKINTEKIKKEPIYNDTLITVQHFRIITGACNLGCKLWMDDNNIEYDFIDEDTIKEKNPIKTIDLLKLLEKTNAYGYEQLKKLITI